MSQIDSSQFANCIRAERKGTNTLIMRKMGVLLQRLDGKMARFELEHRWHASEDALVSSVQGNDFSYWRKSEFDPNKSLFDQFACIG